MTALLSDNNNSFILSFIAPALLLRSFHWQHKNNYVQEDERSLTLTVKVRQILLLKIDHLSNFYKL